MTVTAARPSGLPVPVGRVRGTASPATRDPELELEPCRRRGQRPGWQASEFDHHMIVIIESLANQVQQLKIQSEDSDQAY
jgi:hypothetical protein